MRTITTKTTAKLETIGDISVLTVETIRREVMQRDVVASGKDRLSITIDADVEPALQELAKLKTAAGSTAETVGRASPQDGKPEVDCVADHGKHRATVKSGMLASGYGQPNWFRFTREGTPSGEAGFTRGTCTAPTGSGHIHNDSDPHDYKRGGAGSPLFSYVLDFYHRKGDDLQMAGDGADNFMKRWSQAVQMNPCLTLDSYTHNMWLNEYADEFMWGWRHRYGIGWRHRNGIGATLERPDHHL